MSFPATPPAWPAVSAVLAARGLTLVLRMIDGQLAFPDEQPPVDWRELRLSAASGMITVRREGNKLVLVTWGNADVALIEQRNALAQALADVSSGSVAT